MTDEEKENKRLEVKELKHGVIGLTSLACNLETAVKIGAYDKEDAPRLTEIVRLADLVLSRGQLFIDSSKVEGDMND